MKPQICFVGLDNYPMMNPDYSHLYFGGESVQQALIAKAFARRGYPVSMLVKRHGQPLDHMQDGVRCLATYADGEGLPGVRFIYPKIVRLWQALRAADADVYYQSCADMITGVVAAFCQRHGRKFIYRLANDQDAEPERLKIRFARDRALYKWGLRHADILLPQTAYQNEKLMQNFGLQGPTVKMLVQPPERNVERDVDVLWVNNVRPHKRADRIYDIARVLPDVRFVMIGGPVPGHEELYNEVAVKLRTLPNVEVKGLMPYHEAESYYACCKVFINTSDMEGFPNAFLQAWSVGKPIVSMFDPDGIIARREMGLAVAADADFPAAVSNLLTNAELYARCSANALRYIEENHSEEAVVGAIADVVHGLVDARPVHQP